MNKPSKHTLVIRPGDTLLHAYEMMRAHDIRHLPVVEGGRLRGIVSDRDLLVFANPVSDSELSFPALPVSRVMTSEILTARHDVTVSQAAQLMLESKVGSLPILSADGTFLGLVTASDILAIAAARDDQQPLPFTFERPAVEPMPARS